MSITLYIYWLEAGNPKSLSWVATLRDYLSEAGISINIRDDGIPTDAPWTGTPFILVGEKIKVERYFRNLASEYQHIFADHAYYWILSGSNHDSFNQSLPLITRDRAVVLNWNYKNHNVIRSGLESLHKYPRLVGLSRGLNRVRIEIERIASGRKGPWTPTLILGESGTGKEEVARTLYDSINHSESKKSENKFEPLACGSFVETLLQAQLLGIADGYVPGVRGRPGLLEVCGDGAVFLDDFDTAPKDVAAALLRVMATPENQPATIFRIGEEWVKERKTSVWLIFSTNANIEHLLRRGELREDFIFRFKDRVIHIPPLRERPADVAAIARHIWDELWQGEGPHRRRPSLCSSPSMAVHS